MLETVVHNRMLRLVYMHGALLDMSLPCSTETTVQATTCKVKFSSILVPWYKYNIYFLLVLFNE